MKRQKKGQKNLLSILVIAFFFTFGYSEEQPLFVMFERDPWLMVIGSDSPMFVLYNDGTVIFWQSYEKENKRKKGEGYRYYSSKLAGEDFLNMKTLFEDTNSIIKLKKNYSLVEMTDQPTEEFHWFIDNKIFSRSVYGQLEYGFDPKMKELSFLFNIVKTIKEFRPEVKQAWKPSNVEVMFWSYEYAPDKSISWPSKWPGLKDSSSINRTRPTEKSLSSFADTANPEVKKTLKTISETESYSVYVPSTDYEELITFFKSRREKGAILIDGKKMAASIRFPFPSEKMWSRASLQNQE